MYLQEILEMELGDREKGREWCAGWFFEADYSDLKQGNLTQIVAWAWFDLDLKDGLTGLDVLTKEEVQEIHIAVSLMQEKLGELEEGFNEDVKCMRQSLDPIEFGWHRPLLVYCLLDLIPYLLGNTVMYMMGFSKKRCGSLTYWHRPSSQSPGAVSSHPTIFLHGIGIGVLPYVHLFKKLSKTGKELFVPVQPHVAISLRYYLSTVFRLSPTSHEEVMDGITCMLARHDRDGAEFVGKICVVLIVRTRCGCMNTM